MDSGELEKERGITILAKNTAVRYRDIVINIVDTPGHRDFGSEVERILTMVEGVLLLVDASEGPLPQTRFVLKKALEGGQAPDRPDQQDRPRRRPDARGRGGDPRPLPLARDARGAPRLPGPLRLGPPRLRLARPARDLRATCGPLLDTILEHIPPPVIDEAPFKMIVANIDYSDYLGPARDRPHPLRQPGEGDGARGRARPTARSSRRGRPARSTMFEGIERVEVTDASAGDICHDLGFPHDRDRRDDPRPRRPDAAPRHPRGRADALDGVPRRTTRRCPGSPGKYVTSRHLLERLEKELERNVGLRMERRPEPDSFLVLGRGELSLAILAETMRREGYEFALGRPQVILRRGENGELLEPYEELVIDCAEEFTGRRHRGGRRAQGRAEAPRQARRPHAPRVHDSLARAARIPPRVPDAHQGDGPHEPPLRPVRAAPRAAPQPIEGSDDRQGGGRRHGLRPRPAGRPRRLLRQAGREGLRAARSSASRSRNGDMVVQPCEKKHLTNMRASTSDIAVRADARRAS